MVSNENDSKVIESLSKFVWKEIKLPSYSDVIKHTYANTPFSIVQEDRKLKVYSTDWMLSSRLWFIENWKFVEDKSFFDQDNKYDNSEIDKNWAWWAAVLFEMKDEIKDKQTEIDKNISKLETEKTKLESSSKEIEKLKIEKTKLERELAILNTEKTDINNKKTSLVQEKNELSSANTKLESENKMLYKSIKSQKPEDSYINTNSDWSIGFNPDLMPKSVSYKMSKNTETYNISYAAERNEEWYIDAQIDDWGENTHIMSKDEDTIKWFINHYQNFRDGEQKDIFSEWSDLFDSNNKIELGIDWAWDIKVVDIGSVSCITIKWGLLKDDFVIPLSYDKSNTDNLTLLKTIQDATWLDLSYTIEDNDKWIEWTLKDNIRSYEGLKVTKNESVSNSYELSWDDIKYFEEFSKSDLYNWIPVCDQEVKTIDWKNYFYFEFDDSWFNESYNKRLVEIKGNNITEESIKTLINDELNKAKAEAKILTSSSNLWIIKDIEITWLDKVDIDKVSITHNHEKPWERLINIELKSWSWNISDYNFEFKYETWKTISEYISDNIKEIEEGIVIENNKREERRKKNLDDMFNNK